jgi:hypothetical protein
MTLEHEKTGAVCWPQRRHTLACYLYELASSDFQHERWIEGRMVCGGDDSLPPELESPE